MLPLALGCQAHLGPLGCCSRQGGFEGLTGISVPLGRLLGWRELGPGPESQSQPTAWASLLLIQERSGSGEEREGSQLL